MNRNPTAATCLSDLCLLLPCCAVQPKFLADRIFFALDRTGRGTLTAPDFVASMAVMLSFSPEATEGRYFLLFRIYDVFHRDSLERASLKRILHIAYPEIKSSELNDAVDAFFGKSSALVYEEFRMRLYAYTNSKRTIGDLLTNWFYTICDHLMDEPAPELIAMEQRYNQERGLRKVSGCWNNIMIFWNGLELTGLS